MGRPILAGRTGEGLLPCVSSDVFGEDVVGAGGVRTMRTLEGLLPRVNPDVFVEVYALRGSVGAVGACIWLLGGRKGVAGVQGGPGLEGGIREVGVGLSRNNSLQGEGTN